MDDADELSLRLRRKLLAAIAKHSKQNVVDKNNREIQVIDNAHSSARDALKHFFKVTVIRIFNYHAH